MPTDQTQRPKHSTYWGSTISCKSLIEQAKVDLKQYETKPAEISLSPRLVTVADRLSKGLSRKAAATELGISIHTVNGYIKQLYDIFGVNSQVTFVLAYTKYLLS